MNFGEKLRKYRLEAHLTQSELAEKAGLNLNTIGNYERGLTYPHNRDVYVTLAKILNITPETLRNESEDFIASAAEKYGYTGKKQAQQLVEDLGGLFAGGELSEEEIDGVMQALQSFYWKAKEANKKYGQKKN